MYTVEIYGRVRRAVLVEGKSERAVAQEFGIARETVRKMLRYAVPPGYNQAERLECRLAVTRSARSSAAYEPDTISCGLRNARAPLRRED
jgi:hypothetical protein